MFNFKQHAANIILLSAVSSIAIICIFILYNLGATLTSKDRLRHTLNLVGLESIARSPILYDTDRDSDPIVGILQDHRTVVDWALDCAGAKSRLSLPERINKYVRLGQPSSSVGPEKLPDGMRELTKDEKQLLSLSKSIANQRMGLKLQADDAYSLWATSSIITIILGMLTTILISLSSTEFGRGEGTMQRTVRVLAVIFPAIGTAFAAIIAFYGPQAEWTQTSRTLASLAQLHAQMATGIWHVGCDPAGTGSEKPLGTVLPDWSKRYIDLQTLSVATSRTSGGSNSGGTGQQGPAEEQKTQ